MAKQIIGGTPKTPQGLKAEVDRYQRELQGIVASWLEDLGDDYEELTGELIVLEKMLQNAAERNFKRAYQTGLGNRRLNEDDHHKLQIALAANLTYLQTSLIPAIRARIEGISTGEMTWTLAESAQAAQGFATARAGLYAGPFWTLIWLGVGSAIERKYGYDALRTVPVRRVLDPWAEHCGTCPGKAGEYNSWDEMIAFCGGLPADGSDDCYSNCRCLIELLDEGAWSTII